jgi:hypothetical protein
VKVEVKKFASEFHICGVWPPRDARASPSDISAFLHQHNHDRNLKLLHALSIFTVLAESEVHPVSVFPQLSSANLSPWRPPTSSVAW